MAVHITSELDGEVREASFGTIASLGQAPQWQVAIALGTLTEREVKSGEWYFRGERAGQYAFENARTGEWRFA